MPAKKNQAQGHAGRRRPAVCPTRRKLLKTGAALAVAPLLAGLGPALLLPASAGARQAEPTGRKVLAISASPRQGGNSDLLCDAFLHGARDAGHEAEKIRLAEQDIAYCTGCLACIGGSGECVQDDDMAGIFDRVLAADVLILASPVYFMTFNGQMKTFIDRLCPIYTRIRGKDLYFVLSAAGGRASIDSAAHGFRVFSGCLDGNHERGVIASTGHWDAGQVAGTHPVRQAYEAGLNA